jgi:hypothetical protein
LWRSVSASRKQLALRLARSDILFWTLPFLMFLLIVGTIAQKYIGLQASLEYYFSSWIFFIGFIPLPAGMTLMSILFINMLMKFLCFSDWSWQKAGTILTHFGVLILIIGGGITALTERDGYIVIEEGASANIVRDYHQRVLRIREGDQIISETRHQNITEGKVISIPNTKVTLTITEFCFHCDVVMRPEIESKDWHKPGSSMKLIDSKPLLEQEQNMTGVEFRIRGTNSKQDGFYLTFDKFPKPPQIKIDDKVYIVEMGREERSLPFIVTLKEFKQKLHAGTDLAREYSSDVEIKDGDETWLQRIEMNEPLRYKGYTLYQSSFDLSGEKPFTVLSVVENKGQIFPYVATIIMTIGLLLHMILRRKRKKDEWS